MDTNLIYLVFLDLMYLEANLLQNTQVNNIHSTINYALTWCKEVAHWYVNMNKRAVEFQEASVGLSFTPIRV